MSIKNITRLAGLIMVAALCSATLAHANNDSSDVAFAKNRYDFNHTDTWGYVNNSVNLYSPIELPIFDASVNPVSQYFNFHFAKKFDAVVHEELFINVFGDYGYAKIVGANGKIIKLYADSITFRAPAGNLINGIRYNGALRFYMKSQKNGAVDHIIAVALKSATTDQDSEDVFRDFFRKANVRTEPIIYQSAYKAAGLVLPDVVRNFFSANKRFYRFIGSLPSPPVNQSVDWFIFEEPLDVSRDDIEFLRYKYSSNKFSNGNAAPLQPLNGRTVTYGAISSAAPAVVNNHNNNRDQDCDSSSNDDNNRGHGHNDDSKSSSSYRSKRNNKHAKHY